MSGPKEQPWLGKIKSLFQGRSANSVEPTTAPVETNLAKPVPECCTETVHIAYRGVSDDRLYLAYGRRTGDVKFFKPRGLRVFCAECRRRLV